MLKTNKHLSPPQAVINNNNNNNNKNFAHINKFIIVCRKMNAKLLKSAILRTNVKHRPAPSLFYFPGLTSKAIWPTEHFDQYCKLLSSNYDVILAEYKAIQSKKGSDYGVEEHKLHSGKWDWHSYVSKGKRQADFAVHCPRTTEVLESLTQPKLMANTPFSFAFFSTMYPKSKIDAHYAPCNLRLRCHFPLIVPNSNRVEDCGMRIADTTFRWEVGKPVFFDDAYEHEG
ncbi:aspartyl/asparaginyl beta-hydroxylase domain-containing protein [archaeon]|nr:MAG: aspartyl/asparaginyl beta-hydroxylase domain-containing protein [archaeon]